MEDKVRVHSTLYIKKDGKYKRVVVKSILYLGITDGILHLVTTNDDFSISQNLKQFVQENKIPSLVRVHRSYLVNVQQVESFDQNFLYVGSHQIPIGQTYRDNFMEELKSL